MAENETTNDEPTRRDYAKYGGAVVGGGGFPVFSAATTALRHGLDNSVSDSGESVFRRNASTENSQLMPSDGR